MTQYAIMTPELDSYYHSPSSHGVPEYYDSIQQYVTKEGSSLHRAVLVRMKKKRDGCNIEIQIGGQKCAWIPTGEWRYSTSFKWLIFSVTCKTVYIDVGDKIIKDHYADMLAAPKEGACDEQA